MQFICYLHIVPAAAVIGIVGGLVSSRRRIGSVSQVGHALHSHSVKMKSFLERPVIGLLLAKTRSISTNERLLPEEASLITRTKEAKKVAQRGSKK